MAGFYDNLSPEDVTTLDRLARLLIELRESREALLSRYGVTNEETLLKKILSGELAEHPAYEDYLGTMVVHTTREAIRTGLREYMLRIK